MTTAKMNEPRRWRVMNVYINMGSRLVFLAAKSAAGDGDGNIVGGIFKNRRALSQ
jgi:hypothetical protein